MVEYIEPSITNKKNAISTFKTSIFMLLTLVFFNSMSYSFEKTQVNDIEELTTLYTNMHASCVMQSFDNQKDNDQACKVAQQIIDDDTFIGNDLFYVGMHLLSGNDPNVGLDYFLGKVWIEKAAKKGHVLAQKKLATMYIKGEGVKQNIDEAIYWLEMAAKNGDQDGNLLLGKIFHEGLIVKKDLKKSKHYYGIMCDAGEQLGCDLYRTVNEELLINN